MSELLPCPWCGSDIRLSPINAPWSDNSPCWAIWHVDGTKAYEDKCPMEMGGYDTEAEAIDAWNTRADDYKQAAEYWQRMYEESFTERTCEFVSSKGSDYPPVCSACGYELGIYDCAWYEDGTYGYERNYCPNCGARVIGASE